MRKLIVLIFLLGACTKLPLVCPAPEIELCTPEGCYCYTPGDGGRP